MKEELEAEQLEKEILEACKEYEYTDKDNYPTSFIIGFAAGAKWMKARMQNNFNNIIKTSQDLDPEFNDIVNKSFDELI